MQTISFFEIKDFSEDILESLNSLLPQLSTTANPLTEEGLKAIISSSSSHLYALSVDGQIAAMCTLATYLAPTGRKAWIEDVVVDNQFRGKHLGKLIVEKTIEEAKQYAPCSLMLTSRPARVAANKLYQSVGFEQRQTNVYRIKIY